MRTPYHESSSTMSAFTGDSCQSCRVHALPVSNGADKEGGGAFEGLRDEVDFPSELAINAVIAAPAVALHDSLCWQ